MNLPGLEYTIIFTPIFVTVGVIALAEYLLLTRQHPLIIAIAKAVKAAAIPFAIAFYIVLITERISAM